MENGVALWEFFGMQDPEEVEADWEWELVYEQDMKELY